jgi:tetratricopeptide (TPR) repeat protein
VALVESRPESDAWHWVGASARALVNGDVGGAVSASARALEIDGGNKYAHYQRGLTLSHQHAYQPAAEAFVRLLEIDGNFAYGHYYAALSYYQVRSLVAATNHFERFLELAPDAPERVQVEGVLAALRGT